MYLSSPASTCLALGPGRAVLIFGPAVMVLVGMESSWKQSSVVGRRSLAYPLGLAGGLRPGHYTGRIGVSRCRTDSAVPAKGAPPDAAAGSTIDAASRRASANWHSAGSWNHSTS